MNTTTGTSTRMRWLADCGHWINGPINVKHEWRGKLRSECATCYLNRFREQDGSEGEDYRIMRLTLEWDCTDLSAWHCWGDSD